MYYIHFRDARRIENGKVVEWGPWCDSSYGPYKTLDSAQSQVNRATTKFREYHYSITTTRGDDPASTKAKTQVESVTGWTPDRGPQMSSPKGVTIYKYQLPVKESFELQMPKDSNILRVEDVDGMFWLWAMVDLRKPLVAYKFRAFKTGSSIPDDVASKLVAYAGVCKLFIQQELALYVFLES